MSHFKVFLQQIDRFQAEINAIYGSVITIYDDHLDSSDYPKQSAKALWNLGWLLKEIAQSNHPDLTAVWYRAALLKHMHFLEDKVWAMQVNCERTFKLAAIYLSFLNYYTTDEKAKDLLRLLLDTHKTQLFSIVPAKLTERLVQYYLKATPLQQRLLNDTLPPSVSQICVDYRLQLESNFPIAPALPPQVRFNDNQLAIQDPDPALEVEEKMHYYQERLSDLDTFQKNLEQDVVRLSQHISQLPPAPQEHQYPDLYTLVRSSVASHAMTYSQELLTQISPLKTAITRTIEELDPHGWPKRFQQATQEVQRTAANLAIEPISYPVTPTDHEKLIAIQKQAQQRRIFLHEALVVLSHFVNVLSTKYPNLLPNDAQIPNQYAVFDLLDEASLGAHDNLVLIAHSISHHLRVMHQNAQSKSWLDFNKELPEIKWKISREQRHAIMIQSLIAFDELIPQSKVIQILQKQIRTYQDELTVGDLAHQPALGAISGAQYHLDALNQAYFTEQHRVEDQTNALGQLAPFSQQLLLIEHQHALIAQQIIERDFRLKQIEKLITHVKTMMNQAPQAGWAELDVISKCFLNVQNLLREAQAFHQAVDDLITTSLPAAFMTLKATTPQSEHLPQAAAQDYQSQIQRQNEAEAQLIFWRDHHNLTDHLAAPTQILAELEQRFALLKLRRIDIEYEQLVTEQPVLSVLERKLEELILHEAFLTDCANQPHTSAVYQEFVAKEPRRLEIRTELGAKFNLTMERRLAIYHEFFDKNGIFDVYLTARSKTYFWKDFFTTVFSYMTGTYMKTDQVLRTEYITQLKLATKRYAFASEPGVTTPLLNQLIARGLRQRDETKSSVLDGTYFMPRSTKASGESMQSILKTFQQRIDAIETMRAQPMLAAPTLQTL